MSCVQVAGAASTRGPGVMDSAAFLLMAFDCGCQPGPWHCILAGSGSLSAGLVLTPVPGEGWAGLGSPSLPCSPIPISVGRAGQHTACV